jgi:FAD/FMN-containing dehydrogenase
MSNQIKINKAVVELRNLIFGKVALPGDEGYNLSVALWNTAVKLRPAFIVKCTIAADVQLAVMIATKYHINLTVRGGGHDWAGRSLNQGGMVIDLTMMKAITIDQERELATLGGGVTIGNLVGALKGYDLIAATGSVSDVGMAGLTIGGGYGPLGGVLGMALDNLISADVVLADGKLVKADKNENRDLFWAIRGGGGNFGIVVSMAVRLHVAQPLTTGMIVYEWRDAEQVLLGLAEVTNLMPAKLSLLAGVISDQEGKPVLFISPTWYGDPADGQLYIDRIKSLATPIICQIAVMPYSELIALYDTQILDGLGYSANTRWFEKLTPDVIKEIIEFCSTRTSPQSFINFHFAHGAATSIPLPETAFGIRHEHFVLEIVAAWDMEDKNDEAHTRWAKDFSDKLGPYSLPGGYPNTLGPNEFIQIAAAYNSNLKRLRLIKSRYDPAHVFSAQPLSLVD